MRDNFAQRVVEPESQLHESAVLIVPAGSSFSFSPSPYFNPDFKSTRIFKIVPALALFQEGSGPSEVPGF